MRNIAKERITVFLVLFKYRSHIVERFRKLRDLIVPRDIDAFAEVAACKRLRRLRKLLEGVYDTL